MEKTKHRYYAILVILIAVAALAVGSEDGTQVIEAVGITLDLPDHVGQYAGKDTAYCHNRSCLKYVEGTSAGNCPACGEELHPITFAESNVLPADTIIRKRKYRDDGGNEVSVSIVVSGVEQKSIHRPQQCLPALGNVIDGSHVVSVSLKDGEVMKVMFLDVRSSTRRSGLSSYAYWFVGGKKKTPYHLQRLFWMSVDRIFSGTATRWAYIALTCNRQIGSDEHVRLLSDFIKDFYPLMTAE